MLLIRLVTGKFLTFFLLPKTRRLLREYVRFWRDSVGLSSDVNDVRILDAFICAWCSFHQDFCSFVQASDDVSIRLGVMGWLLLQTS